MAQLKKIRVVVVDDSALVRSLLSEIINRQADMVCVGAASDPLVARQMIRELDPDVITLDVEMPKMDGIEFLSRLMRLRPMPVVMISTLTQRGAEVTMRALELGAVDFVAKPQSGLADGFSALAGQIVGKIRIAASAHNKWIFIGASTGGTEAIKEVLTHLPADAPGILITQHMPTGFTRSFADRLNTLCAMVVKEAEAGERILPGHAYIAPGGRQFSVERRGSCLFAIVEDAALVNRHMPSVEVLFKSAARAVGKQGIGVMLTGMGGDGASAMREMKDAGSYNIVQDEASSVVFGMPREAIAHGAADEILPVTQIASALMTQLTSA